MSEQKQEVVFADGMIFKKPNEHAPDFVKGKISIKVEEFVPFLQKHANNGWVNLDLKKSQTGKLYVSLDSWVPNKQENPAQANSAPSTAPVNAGEDTRQAPPISDEDLPW